MGRALISRRTKDALEAAKTRGCAWAGSATFTGADTSRLDIHTYLNHPLLTDQEHPHTAPTCPARILVCSAGTLDRVDTSTADTVNSNNRKGNNNTIVVLHRLRAAAGVQVPQLRQRLSASCTTLGLNGAALQPLFLDKRNLVNGAGGCSACALALSARAGAARSINPDGAFSWASLA
jgi:hypothetical protein